MSNLLNKLINNNPDVLRKEYESLVVAEIRKRYSQSEENAILRKRLANIDHNNEFEEYNKYVEDCKLYVKEMLGAD